MRRSNRFLALLAFLLVLGSTSIAFNLYWSRAQLLQDYSLQGGQQSYRSNERDAAKHFLGESEHPARSTLVVYVYSDTDPQYRNNLETFIELGILRDTSADYLIIVQMEQVNSTVDLPKLPAHAQYVRHHNECYDW